MLKTVTKIVRRIQNVIACILLFFIDKKNFNCNKANEVKEIMMGKKCNGIKNIRIP